MFQWADWARINSAYVRAFALWQFNLIVYRSDVECTKPLLTISHQWISKTSCPERSAGLLFAACKRLLDHLTNHILRDWWITGMPGLARLSVHCDHLAPCWLRPQTVSELEKVYIKRAASTLIFVWANDAGLSNTLADGRLSVGYQWTRSFSLDVQLVINPNLQSRYINLYSPLRVANNQ